MTRAVDRHEIINEFLSGRELQLLHRPVDGPYPVSLTSATSLGEDGHVEAGTIRVAAEEVAAIMEAHGPRTVVFLETLPPAQLEPLEPLLREPRIADWLRHALLHPDEFFEAATPLTPADKERVVETAFDHTHEEEPVSRVLIRAIGVSADPADALRLGDMLMGADVPEWILHPALDALRAMGTRDARMQVQRVALLGLDPTAIPMARETLLRIAGDLRMRVWRIQDDLVPDCGLDANGQTSLDYGSREFVLELDDGLTPMLVERPGSTRHYALPQPTEQDDPALAATTRAGWDVLREQLAEAVPVQVRRLEEALSQQYRWSSAEWNDNVRRHPLLLHLVPRVIWGTYSKSGRKLLSTFRIARDRTLWGPDDEPYELGPDSPIGLAHPLEIDGGAREAWGEILADYEIATLFPQLDRARYSPPDGAERSTELHLDIEVPRSVAAIELARRGWTRTSSWRGGLQKIFRERDRKAIVLVDEREKPSATGGRGGTSEIEMFWCFTSLSFERYNSYPRSDLQLRDVHPVVYSEAVYELETLRMPQETGGWPAVLAK